MTDYTDNYAALIPAPFNGKPNAVAEIDLMSAGYEEIYNVIRAVATAFDVDSAVGDQLDIIGKIVGLRRNESALFTSNADYRFYIKCKIAQNNAVGYMISDNGNSLQDVILRLFDGKAHVVDDQNMALKLIIDAAVDQALVLSALALGLLPKPQGVGYTVTVIQGAGNFFGFNGQPGALGFGNTVEGWTGGPFAVRIS